MRFEACVGGLVRGGRKWRLRDVGVAGSALLLFAILGLVPAVAGAVVPYT